MNYRLLFVIALIALVVLFTVQNVVVVEIRFLIWSLEVSQALLIFLLLAIGIIIGWFFHGSIGRHKRKS